MRRVNAANVDSRLGRKIRVVRLFCLFLLLAWISILGLTISHGRFDYTASKAGTRFGSPSVPESVALADSPVAFAFQLVGHFFLGAILVIVIYAVLAKIVIHFHGRPLFRRKYPH